MACTRLPFPRGYIISPIQDYSLSFLPSDKKKEKGKKGHTRKLLEVMDMLLP